MGMYCPFGGLLRVASSVPSLMSSFSPPPPRRMRLFHQSVKAKPFSARAAKKGPLMHASFGRVLANKKPRTLFKPLESYPTFSQMMKIHPSAHPFFPLAHRQTCSSNPALSSIWTFNIECSLSVSSHDSKLFFTIRIRASAKRHVQGTSLAGECLLTLPDGQESRTQPSRQVKRRLEKWANDLGNISRPKIICPSGPLAAGQNYANFSPPVNFLTPLCSPATHWHAGDYAIRKPFLTAWKTILWTHFSILWKD